MYLFVSNFFKKVTYLKLHSSVVLKISFSILPLKFVVLFSVSSRSERFQNLCKIQNSSFFTLRERVISPGVIKVQHCKQVNISRDVDSGEVILFELVLHITYHINFVTCTDPFFSVRG